MELLDTRGRENPAIGLNDIFEPKVKPMSNFIFRTPAQNEAVEKEIYQNGISISKLVHG